MRQLLTGGRVFREGAFHPGDLVIENGLVAGAGVSVSKFESGNSIDCRGFFILPGLVDVHVHLREPGFSFKETSPPAPRRPPPAGCCSFFMQ